MTTMCLECRGSNAGRTAAARSGGFCFQTSSQNPRVFRGAETEMLLHITFNTGNTQVLAVLEGLLFRGVVQIRRHPEVTDRTQPMTAVPRAYLFHSQRAGSAASVD